MVEKRTVGLGFGEGGEGVAKGGVEEGRVVVVKGGEESGGSERWRVGVGTAVVQGIGGGEGFGVGTTGVEGGEGKSTATASRSAWNRRERPPSNSPSASTSSPHELLEILLVDPGVCRRGPKDEH